MPGSEVVTAPPPGGTPVNLEEVCVAKSTKSKIDSFFHTQIRRNDTLFEGKTLTQNCVNRSFYFVFCILEV